MQNIVVCYITTISASPIVAQFLKKIMYIL